MHGEHERARKVSCRCGQGDGSLAAGGGAAWPAASSAIAHRRGPLPAAPLPGTPPQHIPRRNAPWVMRSASWPSRSSRAKCAGRRTEDHRLRAGTPRIVRAGPSTHKGTRRSFLTAPQEPLRRKHLRDPPLRAEPLPTLRPDGKGQARGQAQ